MGPMTKLTSVLILSDKSSGSSVLQRELARHSGVNTMRKPPHQEGETLYWSKCAALLGLPQPAMIDSKLLPMSADRASSALANLIAANLDGPVGTPATRAEVFAVWRALTEQYAPAFLEKSPHHLHNRAVLELLLDAAASLDDVDFRFIGLVRNPLDTLYSMWQRWRTVPEARAGEWCRAYENLLWLQDAVPGAIRIIRYEDMVTQPAVVTGVLDFIGVTPDPIVGEGFHCGSLHAWRNDSRFGYQPDSRLRALAGAFGYGPDDLDSGASRLWPFERELLHGVRRLRTRAGSIWRSGGH
jgi:hypothetical protein